MSTLLLLWNSFCTFAVIAILTAVIQFRYFQVDFESPFWSKISCMTGSIAAMVLILLEAKNETNKRST